MEECLLRLQIGVSRPASEKTREFAAAFLTRPVRQPKSELRLYRDIMSEPFTGEHWGSGWDEEVHEGWTDSEDSDASVTSSEDEVVTPLSVQPRFKSAGEIAREAEARKREEEQQRLLLSKLALRELEQEAYWKSGGATVEPRSDLQGWAALSLRKCAHVNTFNNSPDSGIPRPSRGFQASHFCQPVPARATVCVDGSSRSHVLVLGGRSVHGRESLQIRR